MEMRVHMKWDMNQTLLIYGYFFYFQHLFVFNVLLLFFSAFEFYMFHVFVEHAYNFEIFSIASGELHFVFCLKNQSRYVHSMKEVGLDLYNRTLST